jgi:hypothetical protein
LAACIIIFQADSDTLDNRFRLWYKLVITWAGNVLGGSCGGLFLLAKSNNFCHAGLKEQEYFPKDGAVPHMRVQAAGTLLNKLQSVTAFGHLFYSGLPISNSNR